MTAAPLLSIRDLSVAFRAGGHETLAVDRVSFDIAKGETMALVGKSGSGKSVTALSILKLLPYPTASHPSGAIAFNGRDLLPLSERDMRRVRGDDITIVFQEPMTSLNPLHTIDKQIGEILLLHRGLTGAAARARTIEVLTQVGIPDPQSRLGSYPHQLSGGQRQRVMIAMALANEPDLLIADEPTTALDVTVQAQIIELLQDIQKRLGMSLLFITHDLGIVRKIAQKVCVMKEGKIVEQGTVERVFTAPAHPYTRALLAAEPKPDPAPPQPNAPMILQADDLKVWFPIKRGVLRKVVGHIKAVDGVTVDLRKGETLGVVGKSGSGKTTLGLALLRLISSDGPIVFMGNQLQGLRFKQMRPYRRDMQIVFQDPYGSLSPRLSIADIIKEGLEVHFPNMPERERDARVVQALGDVGLDPATRFRFPHEFSGGQRQRIAVARAIVLEPTFVVLDEPTSALDMLIQSQMVDLLRDLQKRRNLTYLFISHDLRVVAALASRLLVMRQGKVVEAGAAADLFKNPKTDYTRALFAAAFNLETAHLLGSSHSEIGSVVLPTFDHEIALLRRFGGRLTRRLNSECENRYLFARLERSRHLVMDRGNTPKIRHDRRDILFRHVCKCGVVHDGRQLAAVRALPGRDRRSDLFVGPRAEASFLIRRDVSAIEYAEARNLEAYIRSAEKFIFVRLAEEKSRRMAVVATGDDDQVCAPFDRQLGPSARQRNCRPGDSGNRRTGDSHGCSFHDLPSPFCIVWSRCKRPRFTATGYTAAVGRQARRARRACPTSTDRCQFEICPTAGIGRDASSRADASFAEVPPHHRADPNHRTGDEYDEQSRIFDPGDRRYAKGHDQAKKADLPGQNLHTGGKSAERQQREDRERRCLRGENPLHAGQQQHIHDQ